MVEVDDARAMRELFAKAEPLLNKKRKGGWTNYETLQVLCERWIADAKDGGATPSANVTRSRSSIRDKIKKMSSEHPDVVNMMIGLPAEERAAIAITARYGHASLGCVRGGVS